MYLGYYLIVSSMLAVIKAATITTPSSTTNLKEGNSTEVLCHYLGKTYKEGEHIETPDKSCFHCSCYAGWTEPSSLRCAIIDCPWQYYQSKPYCSTEYVPGQCCPELKCAVPGPEYDKAYKSGKRARLSTHGYTITTAENKELTLFCNIESDKVPSDAKLTAEWYHVVDGKKLKVEKGKDIDLATFPNNIWALQFWKTKPEHQGKYICVISTKPEQEQVTTLVVRTDPLPVHNHPNCNKTVFVDNAPAKCPVFESYDMPWFYNVTSRQCEQHTGTTCNYIGSKNLFASSSECWQQCEFNCVASSERGNCSQELKRYSYNYDNDICQEFTYSGCGGNINNYMSVEECEDYCADIKFRDTLTPAGPGLQQ